MCFELGGAISEYIAAARSLGVNYIPRTEQPPELRETFDLLDRYDSSLNALGVRDPLRTPRSRDSQDQDAQ